MPHQHHDRETLFAEIDSTIVATLKLDPALLKPGQSINVAGLDSLELLDAVAALEEHFNIDFTRPELTRLRSLDDLHELVCRKLWGYPAPRFAILIPVYNHVSRIAGVLEKALHLKLPVVVVDDGSTDGSGDIAASYTDKGVVVVRHERNMGKGAAIITGMREASSVADFVVTIDADGQHQPEQATRLMNAVTEGSNPIVVGCRAGMDLPHVPKGSRFGRSFSNFWVRASGGPKVTDSQSGYRVYPIADVLSMNIKGQRYQFEVEVLAYAGWLGLPVKEVEIDVVYQKGNERISHLRPFVDFWRNAAVFTLLIVQRLFVPRSVRIARLKRGDRKKYSEEG